MFKKTLSLVTLVAFLLFDWACLSVNKVPVTSANIENRTIEDQVVGQIVGVMKISGKYVQIPKENPARLAGDRIVLSPSVINEIALDDIKDFKQNDKAVFIEITTKDGRTLRDIEGKREGRRIVLPSLKYEPAPIPLSEVNFISVRRYNNGLTLLLVLGIIGVAIGGIYLIALSILTSSPWWTIPSHPHGK